MTVPLLERIAITGLGMVTSLGSDAPRTLERIVAGEPGLAQVQVDWGLPLPSLPVGRVSDELPAPLGAQTWPRSDRMALRAILDARAQAGLDDADVDILIGGTTGSVREAILAYSQVEPDALAVLVRQLALDPLGATAHRFRSQLPRVRSSRVVCSACSSGALAIALGAMRLEQGATVPQLVGGADSLSALTISGFGSLGALSSEPCRPFDARRRGLCLGEGAAVIVLETERMVRARGASVLAWLDGYAVGAEAHHLTHPEPEGRRAAEIVGEAMRRAGFLPSDLGYVNAHGTATLANDIMEARALTAALGRAIETVSVSSSKGQLGHTLGAAGAIEAAIVIEALRAQVLVPTVGLEQADEDCRLRHVFQRGRAAEYTAALSTSFGFGGAGAVVAVSHSTSKNRRPACGSVQDRVRIWVTGTVTLTAAGVLKGVDNAQLIADGDDSTVHEGLPFEPLDRLTMERSRRFDRLSALATLGVVELLNDAAVSPEDIGLVVGNSLGNVSRTAEFVGRVRARGPRGAQPAEFPQLLVSSLSGNASIYAGIQGPVFNVSEVGATAGVALDLAVSCLRSGCARAMIAGTAEMADSGVRAAVAQMTEDEAARVRSEDGAAFLLVEAAERRPDRHKAACELVWVGAVGDVNLSLVQLGEGQRGDVFLGDADVSAEFEPLGVLAEARGLVRRTASARVGRGWSRSASCLAIATSRILAGESNLALVALSSPGGSQVAVFRRA